MGQHAFDSGSLENNSSAFQLPASVKYVVGSEGAQLRLKSSGPSDFLQVPRLVGIDASMRRQVNGQPVEALDQANGVGFWVVSLKHW